MDKAQVRTLSAEAEKVLKAHFGDRVRMAGGSFDDVTLTLKVKLAIASSPEAQQAALRAQFNRVCPSLGLLPSDFDLPLVVNGQCVKLVSVELGRSRFPFVVQLADGRRLKTTGEAFLAARARNQQRKAA